MKPETIKAIFTNLLFVIGVILVIVGFIQGTRTLVNSLTFDQYPLDSWAETKCDQYPYVPAPADMPKTDLPAQPNAEQMRENCKTQLEYERKVKKTEDVVASISFMIAGGTLIFFFRRFILK